MSMKIQLKNLIIGLDKFSHSSFILQMISRSAWHLMLNALHREFTKFWWKLKKNLKLNIFHENLIMVFLLCFIYLFRSYKNTWRTKTTYRRETIIVFILLFLPFTFCSFCNWSFVSDFSLGRGNKVSIWLYV